MFERELAPVQSILRGGQEKAPQRNVHTMRKIFTTKRSHNEENIHNYRKSQQRYNGRCKKLMVDRRDVHSNV